MEWGRIENEARQVPGELGQNPVTLLTYIQAHVHRYILPPVYKDPNHRIMTRDLEREREREGERKKAAVFCMASLCARHRAVMALIEARFGMD